MPTEMNLTEEIKQALNAALDQSESPEQLLANLRPIPFPPIQCSPHGCTGLAIEHLLTRSNTVATNKKEILLNLLSDSAKASSLISAMLA